MRGALSKAGSLKHLLRCLVPSLVLILLLLGSTGGAQEAVRSDAGEKNDMPQQVEGAPESDTDQTAVSQEADKPLDMTVDGAEESKSQTRQSRKEKRQTGQKSTSSNNKGSAVSIGGQEVFRIRARLGPFTPDKRARAVEERLKALEQDPEVKVLLERITTTESGYSTDIVAGKHTIMTVTDPDAEAEGYQSRHKLADDIAIGIRDALSNDLESRSFHVLLIACIYSVVATVCLGGAITSINWIFPRIYRLIVRWKGTVIGPLKIQQAELLSEATICDVLIGTFRIFRVISFLSVLSIYLSVVLSFFPQTKKMADAGVHRMAGPLTEVVWPAIVSYIPNLLFIIFIVVSTYYINTFTHFLFKEISRGTITIPGFDPDWSIPTFKIVRFLIISFALILLFPYLPGAGSPAFQQVSIFLGVLLSLASTGALSHVVSGVFLTYTGALRIGDRVKIADTIGDVTEKTLLATKIRTIKNEVITIPNGLVLGNHIVNYSASAKDGGLILHTSVTIGYDVAWNKVHEALTAAASRTENLLDDPEPFVWQQQLGDFSVEYQINAHTDRPQRMAATYAELRKNIQDEFHKRGIEILSPTYAAVRDGNRSAMPEENLSKDYREPAFTVRLTEGAGMAKTTATKRRGGSGSKK